MEELRPERSISRSHKLQSTGHFCLICFILIFADAAIIHVTASASDSPKLKFHGLVRQFVKRDRIRTTLMRSTPVFGPARNTIIEVSSCSNSGSTKYPIGKYRRDLQQKSNFNLAVSVSSVKKKANKTKQRLQNMMQYTGSVGVYYGIDPEKMIPTGARKPRPPKLEESMVMALDELKMLRLEMEKMRREMQQLKRKMIGDDDDESSYYMDDESRAKALRKKQLEAEKLAAEIELWAIAMLEEGEEEGWAKVECSRMVRASFNGTGRTTAFIKWMTDSRAEKADHEDETKYPCIKCTSTIDAPLDLVCAYLSLPEASPNYNDVVENFEDLEEISPNAKICWASSPQILFVKPRDYITFCHHRWKPDETEVIVNQACEHPRFPLEKEKEGKSCRGYALRGANFLARCPEDPSKTKITILAHCRPGGGLPDWATKTAVKALAPIEPFKLFHKINDQVNLNRDRLEALVQENAEKASSLPPGRTSRPGGFAQLGYACFWPNGGGEISPEASPSKDPSENLGNKSSEDSSMDPGDEGN